MNILFLSLLDINNLEESNIYTDLLREFTKKKHKVYIISPEERRKKTNTHIIKEKKYEILKVKIGNITKTNIIEKGITTLLIETIFKKAIKKYYKNIKFDLVLYATPPITFCNVIKYIKKRDNTKTYLMLKDIFPQNAVDLNMFKKKSIIYKYFRKKEIELYKISDFIGCMSPKNKEYLIDNNLYLDKNKIDILPNSIEVQKKNIRDYKLNQKYRKKYNIPMESKVFMYGGNLGKPQGIPFIIECLKKTNNIKDAYFVVCGTGTEYQKLEEFNNNNNNNIKNFLLLNGLQKEEYNELLNIADIGLIFLDYNFTIPNFPSRILSYMEKGIPILSCTDENTDIGKIIEKNKFGWSCYSNNSEKFVEIVKLILSYQNTTLNNIGKNGYNFLKENYTSEKASSIILKNIEKRR